jgi:hypothetical protein
MPPKMIDLCVALNGPHVGVMLPFFWHSLHNVCGTELQNFRIHFVDKGCTGAVKRWLQSISSPQIIIHQLYETFGETNQTNRKPVPNIVSDCAGTCKWMIDNCGDCEWCIISHFDIAFRQDLLGWYRILLKDGVGQVGSHSSGVVCYRRGAVRQCSVGFESFSGFNLVRDQARRVMVLRHYSDSRCDDKSTPVHGFDVGELLELNLVAKGWEVMSLSHRELDTWRYHLGTGSGHCGDQSQKFNEAMEILSRRGLIPIE